MTSLLQFRAGSWGSTLCAVEAPDGTPCARPANIHLLLRPLGQLNICSPCLLSMASFELPVADRHQFGTACNTPDAHWVPSTPEQPGRCAFHTDVFDDLEQLANQSAGVPA